MYFVETYWTKSKRRRMQYAERDSRFQWIYTIASLVRCTAEDVQPQTTYSMAFQTKAFENSIIKFVELSSLMSVVPYTTFTRQSTAHRSKWYPVLFGIRYPNGFCSNQRTLSRIPSFTKKLSKCLQTYVSRDYCFFFIVYRVTRTELYIENRKTTKFALLNLLWWLRMASSLSLSSVANKSIGYQIRYRAGRGANRALIDGNRFSRISPTQRMKVWGRYYY